jgi:hypothetical protein
MADDVMDPKDPRGTAARAEAALPADDGGDPLLGLGYEAADPALLARLWGEPLQELRP